jgi:hypothetical protein
MMSLPVGTRTPNPHYNIASAAGDNGGDNAPESGRMHSWSVEGMAMKWAKVWLLALLLTACGGGGGGGSRGSGDDGGQAVMVLAAGMVGLDAETDEAWSDGIDLDPLGLDDVDAVYDFTTPADEAFVFDVLSRSDSNTGEVSVCLAHAEDGGAPPSGGPESLAHAGIVPSAAGTTRDGGWLRATGDGFARITIRGSIDRDQILALKTRREDDESTALVRVRIGERSSINVAASGGGDYPDIVEERTIYSSDSWRFGLPTIAVSGDRTSVVTYEGDRADPRDWARYEMRLQYEQATQTVTGGAEDEASPDSGNWRDHEIAALYNVLALVHSGESEVTLRLSFDRGATFAQTERFGAGATRYRARLAQVAMAADYTVAVLFWSVDGATSLMLVEGKPSAFDAGGSPTAFTFGPAVRVHGETGDVVPLLMDAAYSDGGDLVIGYGFSRFMDRDDGTWESRTENRCAVRPWDGEMRDVLVEEDVIVGKDPSVSLVGSGEGMRIFYAYEGRDGVRLRTSEDAGRTFSAPVAPSDPWAHTPKVFARPGLTGTRVDLLYLTSADAGSELHLVHWDDYDTTDPVTYRLTTSTMVSSTGLPPDAPVPGTRPGEILPDGGFRVTEVAWFGYDAVVQDDEIVIVCDEVTYDAYTCFVGAPFQIRNDVQVLMGGATADFVPAEPPPLAPGLTESVPDPDPDHMHQLKLLRLR